MKKLNNTETIVELIIIIAVTIFLTFKLTK
jgi:hypothetical protein